MKIALSCGVLLSLTCCNVCDAGSFRKDATADESALGSSVKAYADPLGDDGEKEKKCSLVIPDNIKASIPADMQYTVFLQLIFDLIRAEYVKNLSQCEITEKAVSGLLSSLDLHSSYLNEKAFVSMKNNTEGEFGGVGIEIIPDEGFVRIISPIDDTPAYKAGLKSGDLIIYIDNECVSGLLFEEVFEKLRGKPKTKVKLKIKRGDKPPFDTVIERDIIRIRSVKAEVLNEVGYIRISTFDKNTSGSIKEFLKKSQKLKGIILDVRNNPGGLLDETIEVCNIFLDGGKIVSTRGRTTDNSKVFSAGPGDLTNGLPIVVLINSGTASAPEILAGALRDNKRAIIIGVRSFGKGSVQKIIPLSDKAAIKITVAKYYTPSGECIQSNGVVPDIEADYALILKPEEMITVREESFNNALDADGKSGKQKHSDNQIRKNIEGPEKKKKKKDGGEEDQELIYRKLSLKERAEKDYQLNKAFDVLKAIEKYGQIGGRGK